MNTDPIKLMLELAIEHMKKEDRPDTKVIFELSAGKRLLQFEGVIGMQIVGLAELLGDLSIRAGMDAEKLGAVVTVLAELIQMARDEMHDVDLLEKLNEPGELEKLVIKFNGEKEE